MRKQFFKTISIILSLLCIILSIFVISRKIYKLKKENTRTDLNSKIISEIDYLDYTVIEAMNKLNNISTTRYKVYTKTINKPDSNEGKNTSSQKAEENTSAESDNSKENTSAESDNSKENTSAESDNSRENTSTKMKDNGEGTPQGQLENTEKEENDKNKISVSEVKANNSLTETEVKNINWDEIIYIYENIYSVWPTIEMDLKKLGMKDEFLNKFNQDLNGIAQSINNKDKKSALVNFYNLYSQLPNYLAAVTDDNYLLTIYNCKLAVLNSYVLADEDNKWKEMSESTAKSKELLKNINNEIDENDSKKASIEKTYAIVNDLENSTILNDKNIFYMQYKNAIQALETM